MSDISPSGAAPARQRPGAVTAAGYMLYAVAALVIVSVVVALLTAGKVVAATKAAYATVPNASSVADMSSAFVYVGVAVDVLFAALFVVLGVFNLRGNNGMRITTWVIAGLGVLCFGCGAVGTGLSSSLGGAQNEQTRAAARQVADASPGWARTITIGTTVIDAILLIAVIILLALPVANAYFRKQAVADPGYPTYPGYPPVG